MIKIETENSMYELNSSMTAGRKVKPQLEPWKAVTVMQGPKIGESMIWFFDDDNYIVTSRVIWVSDYFT